MHWATVPAGEVSPAGLLSRNRTTGPTSSKGAGEAKLSIQDPRCSRSLGLEANCLYHHLPVRWPQMTPNAGNRMGEGRGWSRICGKAGLGYNSRTQLEEKLQRRWEMPAPGRPCACASGLGQSSMPSRTTVQPRAVEGAEKLDFPGQGHDCLSNVPHFIFLMMSSGEHLKNFLIRSNLSFCLFCVLSKKSLLTEGHIISPKFSFRSFWF